MQDNVLRTKNNSSFKIAQLLWEQVLKQKRFFANITLDRF